VTTGGHNALTKLVTTANRATRGHTGRKRPTWAPTLVLEGEIVTLLRQLGWLQPEDLTVARLWARFTAPTPTAPARCAGFELRPGAAREGACIFETLRDSGEWRSGPRYRHPSEIRLGPLHARVIRHAQRYPLLVRVTELGALRVAEFAGRADEQMRIGGVLTGTCAICYKRLTDPISLERGIGPECWSDLGVRSAR
jgi:hypothetical protein